VPFQLSDEMYANIFNDPAAHGYTEVLAGSVTSPKFGYIFIERRAAGQRRPNDGLDWIPSSTANAKHKLLRDGKTELVRHYCSRRSKNKVAPVSTPYMHYLKAVVDEVKAENPGANTYKVKSIIGERWRALAETSQEKIQAKAAAAEVNRYHKQARRPLHLRTRPRTRDS